MSRTVKRVVWFLLLAGALAFAIEGGEYGTSDLVKQRARKRRLVVRIDSLQREVDSLSRYKRLVETDSATQERIAREEFGMVRGGKELLYRFADPSGSKPRAADTGRPR